MRDEFRKFLKRLALGGIAAFWLIEAAQAAVDFEREIKPLIESACLRCHHEKADEGGLRLDSRAAADATIVPGEALESSFYSRMLLPAEEEGAMPPEGPRIEARQLEAVRLWIDEGAPWPADTTLGIQPRIDFAAHVQPILETHCISCHAGEHLEGDVDLSTAAAASNIDGLLVPYHPEESSLFVTVSAGKDDPQLMPPLDRDGPLKKEDVETLRLWIAQGASWPADLVLKVRARSAPSSQPASPDGMELVRRIHAQIVAKDQVEDAAEMKDYSAEIPQTGAPYQMVAIQGGEFQMGSPEEETGRSEDEGPQQLVRVDPFWMGENEVSWDEYEPYMLSGVDRLKNGTRKDFDPARRDNRLSRPRAAHDRRKRKT